MSEDIDILDESLEYYKYSNNIKCRFQFGNVIKCGLLKMLMTDAMSIFHALSILNT